MLSCPLLSSWLQRTACVHTTHTQHTYTRTCTPHVPHVYTYMHEAGSRALEEEGVPNTWTPSQSGPSARARRAGRVKQGSDKRGEGLPSVPLPDPGAGMCRPSLRSRTRWSLHPRHLLFPSLCSKEGGKTLQKTQGLCCKPVSGGHTTPLLHGAACACHWALNKDSVVLALFSGFLFVS